MPIAKGLLVSSGEKKTHQLLEKWSGHVKVFTKVRFFDVIDWDTPGISDAEHKYLEKTHFDFVVCEPEEPLRPLFAVEFDGIGDDAPGIDPHRKLKASTKTRICAAEGLPLLWLEFEEIKEIDGATMLDFIIESYLGGEWVNELKAKGEVPYDDAYAPMFSPTAHLIIKIHQYGVVIYSSGILEMNHGQGWVEVKYKIQFKTNKGMSKIVRSAKVREINFPHFGSVLFAEDLAQYHCLKAFDHYVQDGKFTIHEGIVNLSSD